ncbi:DUF4139 domain-containing protein [Thiobacillus sedimenti]|uniref:DUF4139 domain-containing protein n=1 Tax=Thiobacillus sedimenti TaxID=3110231 RepID=A0ABZ1CIB7_9PROT|nr:DUF4139 domain-containing protein [Thiobacillus sp. SCUT-2]WRS38037.1 DUF4139 domain-containing protein [Thiobacillus sp. SCUT-2]
MMKGILASALLASLALVGQGAWAASRDAVVSTAADRRSMAVTLYADNVALVGDTRRIGLARGASQLVWRDVAAQMQPETAQLRGISNATAWRVHEQQFEFEALTPQTLLDAYVGREVTVITVNPSSGAETREKATVLSTTGGVVLRYADRVEAGVPGRLAFPGVPDTLHAAPTLRVSLLDAAAGPQELELSYLTGGLTWRADYVARLNAAEDRLVLDGWVTLTNQSGADYPDARVQLVAGEVNRVREGRPLPRAMATVAAKAADEAGAAQEALFEYHLYTLPGATSLANNQTKQVALMTAERVPVRKQFLLEGGSDYYAAPRGGVGEPARVGVFIEFDNQGKGLGRPLPGGVVRVYKRDREGHAQFVGEDRIGHAPKNATVRLKLGAAFDVTAIRKQTDFRRLAGSGRNDNAFESAYEIVLKNAKTEAVTVTVREPVPGDWVMVSESRPHAKVASGTAEWTVPVPAEGSATLTYRVRVTY